MEDALIILETNGGIHNLNLGDYFYDESANVIYVGIGDITQGGGGIVPSGVLRIRANGTYDVTEKASVIVEVPHIQTLITKLKLEKGFGVSISNEITASSGRKFFKKAFNVSIGREVEVSVQ